MHYILVGIRPEEIHVAYESSDQVGLPVEEVYFDDMGADLLVRLQCKQTGAMYLARLTAREKRQRKITHIMFHALHAHLFSTQTGMRLGGWDA